MHFYLITFIISILTIPLTWTSLADKKLGITNIFQVFHRTASDILTTQGMTVFSLAFFLYAILQSQSLQSIFFSQRKWLQKRKYLTVALVTFFAAFLGSNLSWFDELIHFYPIVIPLFMSMGFDIFSSFLCLYGGSIAGLMGLVSTWRIKQYFDQSFGKFKGTFDYSGASEIVFRLISFLIFTSIIIIFNIWYCSKNKQKLTEKKNNIISNQPPLIFNKTRKIILVIAALVLIISIFSQVAPLGKFLNKYAEKIPSQISSEWGIFGKWSGVSVDCLFIIGGIVICLLSKQKIMNNLVIAINESIPILLVYVFAAVPTTIIRETGISENIIKKLLPTSINNNFKYIILFSVFGLSILFSFLFNTVAITAALVTALSPLLLSISQQFLIFAAIFAWMGGIIGTTFSPHSGTLVNSLEKVKISYKEFIKKTWILWLMMLITSFCLVFYQINKIL